MALVALAGAGKLGAALYAYDGFRRLGVSHEDRVQSLVLTNTIVGVTNDLRADLILLGPGSLYTSILPNLLIPGIRQAVAKSKARVVLLLNLMTQPGETDGMMGDLLSVGSSADPR